MSARRPSLVLRLVIPALLLAVIAGGAWVALSGVLGPERLKAELQRAAFRATGRELTVGGDVHIGLGLAPSLVVTDLSLANPPGFSRPQMLTAARVTAQVALLPLLAGDLVFEAVTVTAPDILLERTADGTANWQVTAPKRALYDPSAPAGQGVAGGGNGGGNGGGGGDTEIRNIRIDGGNLAWRQTSGAQTGIGIGSATIDTEGATSPIRIALQGNAQGLDFTLKLMTGSFERLRGGPTTALAGSWPFNLDMTVADGTLHVEGGVTHPDQMRAYDFSLTANVPELAKFQKLFPQLTLPALREVNFTTRFSDGTAGELRTRGLSLHAGAADLSATAPGLSIKEATVSAPGPGQLVQLNVDGVYQGTPLRVAGTATQPDFLALTAPIAASISAQIASASLSAQGTVPPGLGSNGLDLTVSARIPDLGALAPLAGRPLPPARDVVFDAKLGDAGYKLRGITLRDMSLVSSLGDLAGTLTVAWSPIIDLRGTLQSKTLDIDRLGLLSAVTAPPVDVPAAPDRAEVADRLGYFTDTKLPVALLRGADADVSLTLGTVVAGGETMHDFQARLQATDGKLALNPFRVTAPQGVIIGGASIDASTDNPPVAINLRSPALSAAAVAAALGAPGAASGPLQVDAQLSGVGSSTHALLASLTGHLGLSLVNGQVSDGLLARTFGSALGEIAAAAGDGTSQVRCFATRADFMDGHGSFRALALETSRLSMDGDGQFDLGTETLNLHLRPTLLLGGTGAAAPVSVKGSFADPKVSLDPVMGGRYGISIGGLINQPSPSVCLNALRVARGGMAGPLPAAAAEDAGVPRKIKKPVDLLRSLFHH